MVDWEESNNIQMGSMHLMSPWSQQSENLLQEGGFNFGHDVINIVLAFVGLVPIATHQ